MLKYTFEKRELKMRMYVFQVSEGESGVWKAEGLW